LQVSEQVRAQLLQRLGEPIPGGGILCVAEFSRITPPSRPPSRKGGTQPV